MSYRERALLRGNLFKMKHYVLRSGRPGDRTGRVFRAFGIMVMLSLAGHAHGFRCNHGLVHMGDTEQEVFEKCGPPDHEHGHKWFYERDSGFLVREVLFVDRKVWRIRAVRPGT